MGVCMLLAETCHLELQAAEFTHHWQNQGFAQVTQQNASTENMYCTPTAALPSSCMQPEVVHTCYWSFEHPGLQAAHTGCTDHPPPDPPATLESKVEFSCSVSTWQLSQ